MYYRKSILFLILSIVSSCYTTQICSQEISLIIKNLPVRDGIIYDIETMHCEPSCNKFQLIIETKDDSCFSLTDGNMLKVMEVNTRSYGILIRTHKGLFMVYSMLQKCNFSPKQHKIPIKKGDFLGIIQSDSPSKSLTINFLGKNQNYYSFKKSITLFKSLCLQ